MASGYDKSIVKLVPRCNQQNVHVWVQSGSKKEISLITLESLTRSFIEGLSLSLLSFIVSTQFPFVHIIVFRVAERLIAQTARSS